MSKRDSSSMNALNNFSPVVYKSPVDMIIQQIRESISSGQLKPGDRLPPERKLCEKLGVGRTHLRDAIRKLEFYGILRTMPQSGTYVAGMGIPALEGLITDVLGLEGKDFRSLVETRVILETNLAQLAALHRTDDDLRELERAMLAHRSKILDGQDAVDEDFMFHLKIADASKNSVLKSFMLIITPDIMHYFKKHDVCGEGRAEVAIEHHEQLLRCIENKDANAAGEMLQQHLSDIGEYVKTIKDGMILNGDGSLTQI